MSGPTPDITSLVIREGVAGDTDSLADSNVTMALESEGTRLDPATVRRGVARVLADPQRGRYLLAVDDSGAIAGHLMLTREWSDWRDGWWWWIQSVYVAPAWRRHGVYRMLHDRAVADVKDHPDVCGLRLYVEPENTGARATYAALGMTENYRVMELPRPQ